MPSGPPNGYNGGSYPAPDQGNGISIYNSGAPESPGGYQQAPNYPQQQLQPANGSQPPNYDAPLQTAAAQPSVAPSQAPHSAAPQQPQPQLSQTQQQPSQQPEQSQQDAQQLNQRQQQCRVGAAQLAPVAMLSGITGGGGRGLILGRPHPAGMGPWKLDPAPAPPTPPCPDCSETTQKQMQDRINDLQRQLDEANKNQRLNNCRTSGDYSLCPEIRRKEIAGHCEGTASNPTPMCYLNPLDTKYCQPLEAAWLAYDYWTGFPLSWGFDAPKKLWDYFKKPSDYMTKCMGGKP